MDFLPRDLFQAGLDARDRLAMHTREAAMTNLNGNFAPTQAVMAGAAREAIFADAVLQAVHARFEEFKTVSKS